MVGLLRVSESPAFRDFSGVDSLARVGDLHVQKNDQLKTLAGLSSLTDIDYSLYIEENAAVVDLGGLDNLKQIGAAVVVKNNPSLASLSGVERLEKIGGLTVFGVDDRDGQIVIATFVHHREQMHLGINERVIANCDIVVAHHVAETRQVVGDELRVSH